VRKLADDIFGSAHIAQEPDVADHLPVRIAQRPCIQCGRDSKYVCCSSRSEAQGLLGRINRIAFPDHQALAHQRPVTVAISKDDRT